MCLRLCANIRLANFFIFCSFLKVNLYEREAKCCSCCYFSLIFIISATFFLFPCLSLALSLILSLSLSRALSHSFFRSFELSLSSYLFPNGWSALAGKKKELKMEIYSPEQWILTRQKPADIGFVFIFTVL